MKTLPLVLFALLVLTGCASTTEMSENDRFIWGEGEHTEVKASTQARQ